MDFNDSAEHGEFRAGVKRWLSRNSQDFVPAPGTSDAERMDLARRWYAARAEAGYVGFGLPPEIGGRPGGKVEQMIFDQEAMHHPMSRIAIMGLGPGMAIPTILAHGSQRQIERFVAPTLCGEVIWCQLFSEPCAGSDLAGIRTSATRREDGGWVVDGQKVWTTGAQYADWGLLLARSDSEVPKHKGLTYFLLDMRTPGIEVRPLRQMSGRSDFNEVFLTDVVVPDAMRVGEVGGGWKVAMSTLSNEHLTHIGDSAVGRNLIESLIRLASQAIEADGRPALENGDFRADLARYYVAVRGIEHIGSRIVTSVARGRDPGPEASIGKMTLTRLLQWASRVGMDLAGGAGGVCASEQGDPLREIQEGFLLAPGYRIGGGTEEISKNIIAEQVLGLPAEPRMDKNVPFRQL